MKTIFAILVVVLVVSLPLILERAPTHCAALERLTEHAVLDQTVADARLNASTERRLRAWFRAGNTAGVIVARNYAIPPVIGCPLLYWQGLFDPELLRRTVFSMER